MSPNIAFIQAKCKFVNIPSDVFLTCVVINAVQTALQNCKYAFNAVCRNTFVGVLTQPVINGLVVKGERLQLFAHLATMLVSIRCL